MDYSLATDGAGRVTVQLHAELPYLQHALEDCLGTDPPAGAASDGPSTYWLDEALNQIHLRLKFGGGTPISSGNVSYLRVVGERIEARYDVDPVDSEEFDAVPVGEFVALLEEWRARVVAESPGATSRRPPPPSAIEPPL